MKKPTDFNKQDPSLLLADALIFGASESILRQESQGQQELVQSMVLPKRCSDWETLKRWGIVRRKDVDDLFCECTLPEGWSKQATGHSMWSDLLDDRGLKRAGIFYKATFYDRDASIGVCNRFGIRPDHDANRSDPSIAEIFYIFDSGLDRIVQRFPAAKYAYRIVRQDGIFAPKGVESKQMGAVMDGRFYFKPRGQYSEAVFTKSAELTDDVVVIDRKDFYDNYHNQETQNYSVIPATENLAKASAKAWLETLPQDDSVWSAEFDFSKV